MRSIGDRGTAVDEVIALYLPQFHPISENDEFWGPGFTEWTNVAAARPLFRGHQQPLLPADLGFYDLRVPEVRAAQADLARRYGVTGFCYWHYWFDGLEVLQHPLREVVRTGEPDFPFCVGWANQSWTGVWHGAPDRMLIEQTYPGFDDHRRHFDTLLETFADPRYIRVDGRPLFLIFEPWTVPQLERTIDFWRQLAEDAGLGGLFVVGRCGYPGWVPQDHGFDGSVVTRLPASDPSRSLKRGPTVAQYAKVHTSLTSFAWDDHFPCVLPRWDNTPRSGRRGLVLQGSTPDLFREQVALAVAKLRALPPGRRLLWVKSWNEWAEGNTLEPDRRFGHGYLEALRDGIKQPAVEIPAAVRATWLSLDRGPVARVISEQARRRAAGQGPFAPRRASRDPVPVILCVDCEPDLRMVDRSAPEDLDGYAMVYEYLRDWRSLAADVTGAPVHFNWFLRADRQIESCYGSAAALLEHYPAFVDEMLAAGDGLGIHPHAFRWSDDENAWFTDWKSSAWMVENLHIAVDEFGRVFGHAPEMLRYGDGVMTNEVVAHAEAAGVKYDLTLEPGRPAQPLPEVTDWANALQPDDTRVPREPYFPDPGDYRRPLSAGTRGIRMIPMTSGDRWLGRSVRSRLEAIRSYGYRNRKQRELLYMALPGWNGKNSFDEMLRRSIAAQRRPYFLFAMRSDWALQRDQRRHIERCLYDLLAQQEHRQLVFSTPAEACALLGLEAPSPCAEDLPASGT